MFFEHSLTMECINLLKDRHKLITDEHNQPLYDPQGYLVIYDMITSWKDPNATKRLIYAWKEHENDFKSGQCKSSDVWKKIAIVLQNENSQWLYTGIQCENKFKKLRKKYVKVKDHNKQSGNGPMTCKFFDELEEVLGDKPCIQPVALVSNLRKRAISTSQDSSSQHSDIENESSNECDKKKKVRKTRVQKELGEWSASLREDSKQREEAREHRHKELIAASDRAVAAYKEMMARSLRNYKD